MTLLVNRDEARRLLSMREAIDAVEGAFRAHAAGRVRMPQRAVVEVPAHAGIHLSMPAWVGGAEEGLGLKVVTVYPDNPAARGLPTVMAIMVLNDPSSGAVLAIMDAGYMTAVRTGAAGGVAARYLARAGARTAGIFGAGVQAETQLEAICAVRPIEAATVYDSDPARASNYVAAMSRRLSIDVKVASEPREAVTGKDIVVTATTSPRPVFDGAWLEPGQHVTAVGAHTPATRELDTVTITRSRVVVDLVEACLAEAGDIIIPIREGAMGTGHIHASLGEVVSGQKPGRQSEEEITVFKSVGLALQDVAVARLVYDKARASGAGTEFSFSGPA